MADPESKAAEDLSSLRATVTKISILLLQLQAANKSSKSSHNSDEKKEHETRKDVNALELAHDAASLVRAHTTKISLLIINKPFTPTAISAVLKELSAGPLPALATALELCDAEAYTKLMRSELQWRVEQLFSELEKLLKVIPLDGQVLNADQKNGTGSRDGKGKGSLATTGIIWQACDNVMELKKLGVAGLMVKKAEEYRDTLKDALEELQEWGEEVSDDEDDEDTAEGGESSNPAQAAIDSFFASQRHIPTDDSLNIRPRLESSLRRLKLIVLLFAAIIKRRFKTLPALPHPELPPELKAKSGEDPGIVQCLDEVLSVLGKIPNITDELASTFYGLDSAGIDKRMEEVFFAAFAAAELLVTNWEGSKDEFSTWAQKFQMAMKKGW